MCAVAICPNHGRKKRGTNIKYSFPKNLPTRSQWISACCQPVNPNVDRIYFIPLFDNDFPRDLQYELMSRLGRKHLKPNAVPSRSFVPGISCSSSKEQVIIFKTSATSEKSPETKRDELGRYTV